MTAQTPLDDLVVVKLGGTTLVAAEELLDTLAELCRRRAVLVVHGGGARLTEWLGRLGVESRFRDGLRVTDDAALEVALAVLRGVVNAELVGALSGRGIAAVGLCGADGSCVHGRRVPELGRVASVASVDRPFFEHLVAGGLTPVLAPLVTDEEGTICNVNADDLASGVAAGLRARHLVLLTDADGVLDAHGRRIPMLGPADAERLIAAGTIRGGMVPKVRGALAALAQPDAEAVIVDGNAPHALERALTDPAFGTRLVLVR
ncbi:acetylglutamate kinase [soil metagenome]